MALAIFAVFGPRFFLVAPALLIDNESHHARVTPFRRPSDQGKAGDHATIDDVVILATRQRLFPDGSGS